MMKFGLDVATSGDFADPRKLADLALEAEQAGRDGIYLMTVNQKTNEAVEIVQPYSEAGATWCVELSPNTLEQYRERIRQGPPQA